METNFRRGTSKVKVLQLKILIVLSMTLRGSSVIIFTEWHCGDPSVMRTEWSIVKICVFDYTWLQVKLYWTMTKEIVFTRTMRFLWDLKMAAVSLPKRHQHAHSDVMWKHSVLTRDHCERSEMNNDTGDIIKIIPLFKQQQKNTAIIYLDANTPYSKMAANKLFFCLHVN